MDIITIDLEVIKRYILAYDNRWTHHIYMYMDVNSGKDRTMWRKIEKQYNKWRI